MALTSLKLFVFLLIVFFSEGGMGQKCKISDISISERKTGRQVGKGLSEFEVVVKNNCACAQFNLLVGCPGFNPQTRANPRWLKYLGGGDCLINSGYAVIAFPVRFVYSSNLQLGLFPKKSDIRC
ncbi:hypothetical protein BVC80_757g54 [Macleaya cordata]|uniref:Uncharacterized protein n=1 Tax=Macleaya cordata TaxID=56857 RepID=A0A200QRZ4_MACCD|nr:hypothetical protein BVC80_757g54 [Macleaya cordata]